MRRRRESHNEPVPPEVWFDVLAAYSVRECGHSGACRCPFVEQPELRRRYEVAANWLIARGYGFVGILQARVAHRRGVGCPCPEHSGRGVQHLRRPAGRSAAAGRNDQEGATASLRERFEVTE